MENYIVCNMIKVVKNTEKEKEYRLEKSENKNVTKRKASVVTFFCALVNLLDKGSFPY